MRPSRNYRREPTIGEAKEHGIKQVRIYCDLIGCFHNELFDLTTIGLPDEVRVIDIPKRLRLVCSKCGNRNKIGVRFENADQPKMDVTMSRK
jgi:hypothetical protein